MLPFLEEISALNQKIKECQQDLDELLDRLIHFEKTYKIPSQEFFKKFSKGALPHETDYFEWHAHLDMSKKLVARIKELEGELGDALERKLLVPA